MKYSSIAYTDIGIKKQTNQDSCCFKEAVTDKGTIFMAILCDGMGGLAKGEVASATLIQVFADWFEQELPYLLSTADPIAEIRHRWDGIIQEQNHRIANYGKQLGIQLGSTLSVLLILEDGRYLVGHVGDSRIYCITDSAMNQITEDQTVIAREIKMGRLTPEQAETDPRRNVLLQCVGASNVVEPAFYEGNATPNQCWLLCSDGFRHVITAEEIFHGCAPSYVPDEATMYQNLMQLTELNKARQETDNITALLIKTKQEV